MDPHTYQPCRCNQSLRLHHDDSPLSIPATFRDSTIFRVETLQSLKSGFMRPPHSVLTECNTSRVSLCRDTEACAELTLDPAARRSEL